MLRLFSPFTQSGRFALLLVVNLIASGGASAQDGPPDRERQGPVLVAPVDGATVDSRFIVRIGFAAGGGRHGPAEGTGIMMDAPPPPAPDGPPPPRPETDRSGPSEGTGLAPFEHRRGPHFVLLIDQPPAESGTPFHADARHIAFPAGLPQMTVDLPPGQHRLLLQRLDHDGNIVQRRPPQAITVTVR